MNDSHYNHTRFSIIIYTLTMIVALTFAALEFPHWPFADWLKSTLLNFGYVSLMAWSFFRSGLSDEGFWFRKYVLTYAILLALLEYNLLMIRFVWWAKSREDVEFLMTLCVASMIYALPFLLLLFVLSCFIKKPKH
jgi:hypothetical protein